MEQIQALIQLSDTCSQSIDFGCFLAPLQFEDTQFGWWLDKSGKNSKYEYVNSVVISQYLGDQQYFFNGNHVGEHICACGEDSSCLDTGGVTHKCNCDANKPDWTSDDGIITAKDLLPVTSFNYGPLEFDIEQANFTIGRLKCSG